MLEGKHILVTGGTGFIGSHLVEKLLDEDCLVVVPYIEIQKKSYFVSQKLEKKVRLIKCDVRDYRKLVNIIKRYKIQYVFHLAAKAIVEENFVQPLQALETNIMGTVNICEAARKNRGVRGLIVTSSDKAYGKIPKAVETKPISGDHPYEVSKSSADLIAQAYYKTYNLPVIVTRFGNVYGEGDVNFSRIIPGLMKAMILKRQLKLRSDGKYVRDYIYVGDIVESLILLINNIEKCSGEAFNVSSEENFSVLQLIKKIEKALKLKSNYKILNIAKNEIPIQSVDFKKIKSSLGWIPKNNLEGTAQSIFAWYSNYLK